MTPDDPGTFTKKKEEFPSAFSSIWLHVHAGANGSVVF